MLPFYRSPVIAGAGSTPVAIPSAQMIAAMGGFSSDWPIRWPVDLTGDQEETKWFFLELLTLFCP
jgi:hypothetical protein